MFRPIILALLVLGVSSCAALGLKSNPWPSAVEIHDREALEFLRSPPRSDGTLAGGLATRPLAGQPHLLGLAVSGGGTRATAFTLGIMAELQRLEHAPEGNALDRIDFISSISGGSWAVAAWLAGRARATGDYVLQDNQDDIVDRFERATRGRVRCWARRFDEQVTQGVTFGDAYRNGSDLPAVHFNATVLPAQYPFVFSEPFLNHYEVRHFGSCGDDVGWPARIDAVSLGFAAATSGSVPAFYSSYALTDLCDGDGPTSRASFCHRQQDDGPRDALHLVDGALYDNIGYKTAFEIFFAHRAAAEVRERSLIVVNSDTDTLAQTVAGTGGPSRFLSSIFIGMSFPGQDAMFRRMHRQMFQSVGVENVVLLDFYSTAGFGEEQVQRLEGLRHLAHFAATNVDCYRDDGRLIRARPQEITPVRLMTVDESLAALRSKSGDCLAMNFYRTGTLAATTYETDPFLFRVMWQLGQLSVRMNADRVTAAAF